VASIARLMSSSAEGFARSGVATCQIGQQPMTSSRPEKLVSRQVDSS